jgi:predicted MFS family arabinose efflux permease
LVPLCRGSCSGSVRCLLLELLLFNLGYTSLESVAVPFERRVVLSLAALYMFRMLGLFMLLPVLALYGEDYRHASPALLGLALGAYGFSQALLQIPFGVFSDRIGRKPVILAGLIIFALGSVVAAQADSVYELIAGRFLQGCGAISAAVMALLTDLTSEENRTKAMATIGASIGISFSLALIIGPLLAAWAGIAAIFWLTTVLAILGIYILLQLVPATSQQSVSRRDVGAVPALLGKTLRHPELLRLNLGIFVLHFVLMASFMVVPLILEQQLQISREYMWAVYFPVLGGAFVAMLPFIIIAEKRRKIKPVFLSAIALLGVMELALIAAPPVRMATFVALFFFFMAFNLLEATLPSMVSKVAPVGAKGTATGIYSSWQFLGAFCGGSAGGWLLQQYGAVTVFSVCALLVAIWLVVAWFMTPPKFLASLLIPLQHHDGEQVAQRLRAVDGVVEVLVIESERVAYLKVDPQRVDRQTLTAIVQSSG